MPHFIFGMACLGFISLRSVCLLSIKRENAVFNCIFGTWIYVACEWDEGGWQNKKKTEKKYGTFVCRYARALQLTTSLKMFSLSAISLLFFFWCAVSILAKITHSFFFHFIRCNLESLKWDQWTCSALIDTFRDSEHLREMVQMKYNCAKNEINVFHITNQILW